MSGLLLWAGWNIVVGLPCYFFGGVKAFVNSNYVFLYLMLVLAVIYWGPLLWVRYT